MVAPSRTFIGSEAPVGVAALPDSGSRADRRRRCNREDPCRRFRRRADEPDRRRLGLAQEPLPAAGARCLHARAPLALDGALVWLVLRRYTCPAIHRMDEEQRAFLAH